MLSGLKLVEVGISNTGLSPFCVVLASRILSIFCMISLDTSFYNFAQIINLNRGFCKIFFQILLSSFELLSMPK